MSIIQTDLNEISRLSAKAIIDAAKHISKTKEYVTLALPGGRSVKGIYDEWKKSEDSVWCKVHIFMVDERAVPVTDTESNFKLIWESFAGTLVKRIFYRWKTCIH